MSAITPTSSFDNIFPQPRHKQTTTQRYWKRCVKTYHNHSDLITSLGIFSLNTVILTSKIFKQIPHLVHRTCYAALSFTGVMWMNIQLRDLVKNGNDLFDCIKEKDMEGIVFTAAKVSVKSLNILLTGALLAASIISLCAFPEIALAMYAVMRPFSLFSLVVGIGTEIYDHRKNASLLNAFKRTAEDPTKVQRVMKHFLYHLYHKKDQESRCDERKLARHTFRQLDHFAIEAVHNNLLKNHGVKTANQAIKKLDDQGINELFNTLHVGLKQKIQYTEANLGMIIIGYLSMGICKMWPDSLIQSSVTWAMSALYTGKMIWQKAKHHEWSTAIPK